MADSRNTEVQIFSGGLHLRPEPHLINTNEARILSNVDIRSFSLKPNREPEFVKYTSGSYVFFFNGQLREYVLWRSNVVWNQTWYWSNHKSMGKTLSDGTTLPLGIQPPSKALDIATETPAEGDGLTGDYTYVYTYYHKTTGAESAPSPESVTIKAESQALRITGFVNTTDYEIKLYRIGGVFTAYTCVETISGQTTDYLDDKKFTEVEATILDTTRSFPPPSGAQFLTEHQGRFYCSLGDEVYYSAPGKPDSWYLLDMIRVEEEVTMLASVSNGLLIASTNKTWLLTGNNPMTFTKHLISESEGCVSAQSLAVLDGTAVWLGQNGFLQSNGANVVDISTAKLGIIKGLDPRSATIYNRQYVCVFGGSLTPSNDLVPGPEGGPDNDPNVGDLVPGSTSGTAFLSEGGIIIDFSFGTPVFSTFAQTGVTDVGYYDGFLYQVVKPAVEEQNIVTEDGLFNIVTESGLSNIVADVSVGSYVINKMYEGTSLSTMRYLSPLLTDGSIGLLKQYEKVRITFYGEVTITIISDNWEVMQKVRLHSEKRTSEWIGIPVTNNRAYGIRFTVVGLAVVESIMYTWTPWEVQ